jgi:hypothetical protein
MSNFFYSLLEREVNLTIYFVQYVPITLIHDFQLNNVNFKVYNKKIYTFYVRDTKKSISIMKWGW